MMWLYWLAAGYAFGAAALVMLAAVGGGRRRREFDAHAEQAVALATPLRCLVCGGIEVADYMTHSRLAHHPSRPLGPEDDPAFWGAR